MPAERKPVLSLGPFACGKGGTIEGAVWDNPIEVDGRKTTVSAVSFARNYRDGANWKKTQSMPLQDIPVLIYLLRKAEEFLRERKETE